VGQRDETEVRCGSLNLIPFATYSTVATALKFADGQLFHNLIREGLPTTRPEPLELSPGRRTHL
jgi:hypothetical protein